MSSYYVHNDARSLDKLINEYIYIYISLYGLPIAVSVPAHKGAPVWSGGPCACAASKHQTTATRKGRASFPQRPTMNRVGFHVNLSPWIHLCIAKTTENTELSSLVEVSWTREKGNLAWISFSSQRNGRVARGVMSTHFFGGEFSLLQWEKSIDSVNFCALNWNFCYASRFLVIFDWIVLLNRRVFMLVGFDGGAWSG